MRVRLAAILLVGLLMGHVASPADSNPELARFQGSWEVVELAEDGRVIPRPQIRRATVRQSLREVLLEDADELAWGTDPLVQDTDGDLIPDLLATAKAQRWDPAEAVRALLAEELLGNRVQEVPQV